MPKVKFRVNNNKVQIITDPLTLDCFKDEFKLKAPGYFFSSAYRKRVWDGYKRYVTEAGYFDTGLFPKIYNWAITQKYKVEIIDERESIKVYGIKTKFGDKISRDHQDEAIKSIVENRVGNIPFPRGIVGAATNSGKTLIAAGIYKAYQKPTIFLFNLKEIFQEVLDELPLLLPNLVGYYSADTGEKWNKVMLCMVPTLLSRWDKVSHKLSQFRVCIVDECDLATSASYKKVLTNLLNTQVRVGLSGSVFKHKDKTKNESQRAFFGDELFSISNRELMDKGYSSEVVVKILKGNSTVKVPGNYKEEYEMGIVKNRERNLLGIKRVKHHLRKKRLPILVICQRQNHVIKMYKLLVKKIDPIYVIDWVHHERKDRTEIIKRFKNGDIDILVGSMILKRAKNFPLMSYLLNMAGGDSWSTVLQILGRLTRKGNRFEKKILEDFFDTGKYLLRHSKHRIKHYKAEKIKVVETYKIQ